MSPGRIRALIILAVLVLWEALPRSGLVPVLFLPPLSLTLAVLAADWPTFAAALGVTLSEVAVALVFAVGGGLLTGALVGGLAGPRRLLLPVFSSLYAVPLVVLYPVMTAWFGIGAESKIAFASVYGFFPTMLATAAGIRTIDPQLLLTARSMGATPAQRLLLVILPAAIPTVLSGLRLGGALVIVGVVVAEMLIASAGIGYLVTFARTVLDSPRVFAGVLLVLLIAIGFDLAMRWVERRCALWSTAGRPQSAPAAAVPT
ncbi:ABC transporter permease [Belnapia sp. T6]|uniref:ABC transporter permease n=1 Tax=Belnapia mucosa TaxID=2804532 RepID=A0ABS1UYW2_9PROT|nr:ABC transporter permease [Belnapia mucosa]MBL6454649.1 ABC transporter permease [Belnapia mucosa]